MWRVVARPGKWFFFTKYAKIIILLYRGAELQWCALFFGKTGKKSTQINKNTFSYSDCCSTCCNNGRLLFTIVDISLGQRGDRAYLSYKRTERPSAAGASAGWMRSSGSWRGPKPTETVSSGTGPGTSTGAPSAPLVREGTSKAGFSM